MYTNKENEKFRNYLEGVFRPAQTWAHSPDGKAWIEKHIPSLHKLRSREDEVMSAVYAVSINGICCYVGQSLRTVKRLYCHAHSLAENSLLIWGMTLEEVDDAVIEVAIKTPPLPNEIHRLAAEKAAIRVLKPVLQPYYELEGLPADYALPRASRRRAMIEAGVIEGGNDNDDEN